MKRIGLIVLAVCLMLPMMAVVQPPRAQAANGVVRVLAIGHSYSNNATQYIDDIAESMGLGGKIEVYSLYYAGCSLQQHVNYYNNNQAVYELYRGGVNVFGQGQLITMQKAFEYKEYDYVTFQQSPENSAHAESFNPVLGQLANIVRKEEPRAKFQIHQTWAWCNDCAVNGDGKYLTNTYASDDAVFELIRDSYEKAAKTIGAVGIVPSGEAVQLAKAYGYGDFHNQNASGDVLQCQNGALYADSIHHLNQRGRYLVACVWIEHFLGKDTRTATYVAPVLEEDDCEKLRQIAHETVTGEKGPLKEQQPSTGTTTTTANTTTTTTVQNAPTVTTTQAAAVAQEDADEGDGDVVPMDTTLLIVIIAAGVLVIGGMVTAIVVVAKKK